MISFNLKVNSLRGINAENASKLANLLTRYESTITMTDCQTKQLCNPKSILSLIALGLRKGSEIQIKIIGKDELQVQKTITNYFLENNLV